MRRTRDVVYLAGPYRSAAGMSGVWENIMRARAVAAQLWRMGFATLCPHANSIFMDGPDTDRLFLDGDLELLRRCDILVTVPGWELSEGARREVLEAQSELMPVYHWPDDAELLRKRLEPDDLRVEYAMRGSPDD